MSLGAGLETVILFTGHVAGAVMAGAAAVWCARFGERQRPDRAALLAVLVITALWCIIVAANGAGALVSELAGSARNLALLWLIDRLFASDGRSRSLRPVRPLVIALVGVEFLHVAAVLLLALSMGTLTGAAGLRR